MGGALGGPYTLLLGPMLLEISTSFPGKKSRRRDPENRTKETPEKIEILPLIR